LVALSGSWPKAVKLTAVAVPVPVPAWVTEEPVPSPHTVLKAALV
jgi:hypothetical protein